MFAPWFRRLFHQPAPTLRQRAPRPKGQRPRGLQLYVEALEQRAVPAFLAPVTYPTGSSPAGIAVGDFNADGRDDMAVVNSAVAGSVSVLLGNADGSFTAAGSFATAASPVDATAGDLNHDGKLDL